MRTKLLLILSLVLSTAGFAQSIPISPNAEISLLTIGQGYYLYDSFGHTAIHVQDKSRNINVVFNYGVYDFDAPNFYGKFAQGQLLYRLRSYPYSKFFASYKADDRWIKAQVLNLNPRQKQRMFDFLVNNAKPENSQYAYDFFYDNCATRPIDVVKTATNDNLVLNLEDNNLGKTHRALIHDYLHFNTWGSLGIDIALGSVIDKPIPPEDYLFLPDYTMDAFAKAHLNTRNATPIVKRTEDRFIPTEPAFYRNSLLLSPLIILSLFSLLLIYKTYVDLKIKRRPYVLDKILFFVTGLIGLLLFLLWVATDHTATAWNYNILWAFPLNLIAMFGFSQLNVKKWFRPYMKLLIILLALLTSHWIIGVQIFALTLIPVLLALLFRYVYILKAFKKINPHH